MPLYLLLGALVVVAIAALVLLWQFADRQVRARITAGEAKAMIDRMDAAEAERRDLERRIEQLEAIAAEQPLHVATPDRPHNSAIGKGHANEKRREQQQSGQKDRYDSLY